MAAPSARPWSPAGAETSSTRGSGVGGEGGRHVDHGGLGVSGGLRLSDGAEDGETEMLTACLALVNTTNNLGAVGKSLFSMECTLESENQKES